MAAFQLSYPHGQSLEDARSNFIKGMSEAQSRFGSHLKRIEWSSDQTSAKIGGSGFDLKLWVDDQAVHAEGQVPFLIRLALEKPIRKFLEETFQPRRSLE
jgi:hypothetical protein